MPNLCYQIGPFAFRLDSPEAVPIPDTLRLFRRPDGTAGYAYSITVSSEFPAPEGNLIARRPDLLVFQGEQGESRLLFTPTTRMPYAFYRETDAARAEVFLKPEILEQLQYETFFCSLLALERRVLAFDQLILHSAYIKYQGRAILFSAPSETGKTTQATLWERYRGAETVNGDRSLLGRRDGVWYAQGWPVCGSSCVCHDEAYPIRAVVMLSQAKENTVRRLGPMEAMRLIFSQITINRWNPVFARQATDLVLALCMEVPIFHLGCTISEEAVQVLERGLEGI